MSGWFAMKRGVHDHPLFHKQPERLFVWTWIVATAAWKDTRQDANGKTIIVKRGQLLTSYRQISNATGVGVQVIRTLLDRLRDESAIDTDTNTGRLLITVCNYDKYQTGKADDNTDGNTPATQQQHTKEQVNNSSKEDGASPPSIFDHGLRILTARGVPEKQARSVIGKWRSQHGEDVAWSVLRQIERSDASDPVPYGERIVAKRQPQRDGFVSMGAFGEGEVIR